ncbi:MULTISPECIES: hypothetical protein [unclassified Devosia]|uniref:hypothetical protein n=1 Tax=unclassified Devosia TaxID=196773 RepID=UPI0009605428|nr:MULTISPECIES: hypothetical protein [unclassified Devosia]MBN9364498.1 hypothetical protein [Devosia sp.]OJX20723.1 MAG: hypothetical protein BGO83_04065 [Devosia sp. 66-14]
MAENSVSNNLVFNAAFVRREHFGKDSSRRFRAEPDAAEIYVYDTNIIITLCAPWITGPLGIGVTHNGYGEIFPAYAEAGELGDRRAEKLARQLAQHAVGLRLNGELAPPIFQFGGHAQETNNVYRAVRRSFETYEPVNPERTRARRVFELMRTGALLRDRIRSGNSPEGLRHLVDQCVDILLSDGEVQSERARAVGEWDNYYELENKYGGIFPLHEAPHFLGKDSTAAAACTGLDPAGLSEAETRLYDAISRHWRRRLATRHGETLEADVKALTELFLINARLQGTPNRVVFVTGDRDLVEEVHEGIPVELVPAELQELARHFSRRHVRHLWAYLSDAVIEPADEQRLVSIFDGLVEGFTTDPEVSPSQVRGILTERKQVIPESQIQQVLQTWNELTRKSLGRAGLRLQDDAIREAVWRRLVETPQTVSWTRLVELLEEDVARIRDRTALALSDVGIGAIINAYQMGRRNPPDLHFESLENTDRIFRRLSIVGGYADAASFQADYRAIAEDCYDSSRDGDDRQESHLKFLALGAAFASANRWMISHGHALRAIAIIERSRRWGRIPVRVQPGRKPSHMSGREAYLLAAVCRRMLAASPRDLEASETLLQQAEAALVDDKAHETARGITPLRFRSERLAASLSAYYLSRHAEKTAVFSELVSEVYHEAAGLLDEFAGWRGDMPDPPGPVTMVTISTNMIQAYVISEFRRLLKIEETVGPPVTLRHLEVAVGWIDRLTNWHDDDRRGDRVTATPLTRAYANVGELFLREQRGEGPWTNDELGRLIDESSSVMPYDTWRFSALRRLAEVRFGTVPFEPAALRGYLLAA